MARFLTFLLLLVLLPSVAQCYRFEFESIPFQSLHGTLGLCRGAGIYDCDMYDIHQGYQAAEISDSLRQAQASLSIDWTDETVTCSGRTYAQANFEDVWARATVGGPWGWGMDGYPLYAEWKVRREPGDDNAEVPVFATWSFQMYGPSGGSCKIGWRDSANLYNAHELMSISSDQSPPIGSNELVGFLPGGSYLYIYGGPFQDSCILAWTQERLGWSTFDLTLQLCDAGGCEAGTPASGATACGLDLCPPTPNPFIDETAVRFVITEDSPVKLGIYDVCGRLVSVLLNSPGLEAGQYTERWDGRTTDGLPVSSGIYFCCIEAGAQFQMRKIVVAQ